MNPDSNSTDFKMMGKHAESKYYKNIFAKMAEANKETNNNEGDFEDVDEEEEEEK